jgi:hypothetical protein
LCERHNKECFTKGPETVLGGTAEASQGFQLESEKLLAKLFEKLVNLYKISKKFNIFSKYFQKYFNLKIVWRKFSENYRKIKKNIRKLKKI